jgi:hypothetical protein
MNIASCIFSYEITKGMKSFGPKGLLKSKKSKELINCQISTVSDIGQKTYIIVGFGSDKLIKKLPQSESVQVIKNENYKISNEGYALKLLFNNFDHDKSDGLLIISNGLLVNFPSVKFDQSKIFFTTKNDKHDFNLGCVFDQNSNILENIFYNINDNVWCECIFISNSEINIIKQYMKTIDIQNMFLFEIINNSIRYGAQYTGEFISPHRILKIQSAKDSSKIKEVI